MQSSVKCATMDDIEVGVVIGDIRMDHGAGTVVKVQGKSIGLSMRNGKSNSDDGLFYITEYDLAFWVVI